MNFKSPTWLAAMSQHLTLEWKTFILLAIQTLKRTERSVRLFFFLVRKFSIARISCDGWKGHHLMLALIGKATAKNDAVYFVETVHVNSSQYAHCELLRLNAFRMHHQLFIQMWFNFFRHNHYISAHLKTVCMRLSFAIMCKQTKWHRLKIEMKLNSWQYSTLYTVCSS